MRAALLAEYRKLVSTRIWWLLLLVMLGYLVFIGAAVAASLVFVPEGTQSPLVGKDAAQATYSLVNGVGYVFPLVIGSLAMTTEFRHKTITQSLLVEPNRTRFLLAKLLSVVPIGLVAGVVGQAATVAGGAPLLAAKGDGSFLGDADVVAGLLYGVVVVALWAVMGVAFGTLVSNQVAAIVVILAFTQFVEPILRIGLSQVDALAGAAAYLPGGAADSLIGASFLGTAGSVDLLPRWAAALVLVGYAAGFAVLGRLTTLRRDIG
ncbi:ABC transporter permease [Nocardioides daeguensis]|uniref:ABC transporter permease n=1 Tax=Nocardioides daeguensis TaxID=908359 RepID=A0ABP6W2W4_9ACTN|nr:ABC transporter permease [Nocardioides daeguensis]MBV6727645.1 ABC transporter permease [Nocardioides daeguensis]MCR1775117.1 ABC transporter permease [Nocardioides daeguensis]